MHRNCKKGGGSKEGEAAGGRGNTYSLPGQELISSSSAA